MSELPALRPDLPARGRIWDQLLTVVTFTAIGPLVGSAVITLLIVLVGFYPAIKPEAVGLFPFVLTIVYPLGVIPAFVTGLIVAVRDYYVGTTLREALLIGLVPAAVAGIVIGRLTLVALIIVVCAVAANAVCWRITRWQRWRE